jgi:hypothetical protein
MPTVALDRLLFAQGGKCFFCEQPLPRAEASVEHLVAVANGGANHDGNCVACCKAVNALLGSMSLKEKFRVVLNQSGRFVCPNNSPYNSTPPVQAKSTAASPATDSSFERLLATLRACGSAKPRKPKTLRNHIATLFPGAISAEVEAVIVEFKAAGKLSETKDEVTYDL